MSLLFRFPVAQANHVYVQRAHALQEEAEGKRAAGDFVGQRLGVLVDANFQERPRQQLVGHVLAVELRTQ
jgi:hypothetical protein